MDITPQQNDLFEEVVEGEGFVANHWKLTGEYHQICLTARKQKVSFTTFKKVLQRDEL